MRALVKLKQRMKVVGLLPKDLPLPERVFGKQREMTGFLATLTDAQKERVLAYRGEDTVGDEAFGKALR
jgi:hypothetical protein